MNELVIANGLVVNADGRRHAHVVVAGGRVQELVDAALPVPPADRVVDARGRVVVPGGVDGHCHIAQVTGRYRTLDDFAVTTTAALWGGTTTVLDFGIPRDAHERPLDAAMAKRELAASARCDVGLHAAVVVWDETVPDQLEALAAMGIRSVKLYMTNRGTTMAEPDTVLRVLRQMARLDGLTYVHAEHDAIIHDCTQAHVESGRAGVAHLPATRPELAEEASVREVIAMAEYVGAPVYLVHQSTPGAVDLVDAARRRGQKVLSETCPHYVAVDDSVYGGRFPEWYACCPPLRSAPTVAALRARLTAGTIDTVASDHSCYDLSQKRERSDDVRFMPHGLPGVETRLPATLSTLVDEYVRSTGAAGAVAGMDGVLERFVALVAATPARVNGVPGKGWVAPGADADLVVLDPDEVRPVVADELHMGTDFTPFEGRELRGRPQVVVSGGRVVLEHDVFDDPGPVGRFLERRGFHGTTGDGGATPVAAQREKGR